jgi:hypothetical protein
LGYGEASESSSGSVVDGAETCGLEGFMRKTCGPAAVAIALLCFAVASPSFAQSGGDKHQPSGQGGDKAAAADPISGEWEGLVDLPDGPMPFTMTLKLDKDKVTGDVGGPSGSTPITEGSWADGKLTIAFVYVDGASVVMSGSLTDGQFAGSLDYGGQMVMNWAAKKKGAK